MECCFIYSPSRVSKRYLLDTIVLRKLVYNRNCHCEPCEAISPLPIKNREIASVAKGSLAMTIAALYAKRGRADFSYFRLRCWRMMASKILN
jgi:hypothetical protein